MHLNISIAKIIEKSLKFWTLRTIVKSQNFQKRKLLSPPVRWKQEERILEIFPISDGNFSSSHGLKFFSKSDISSKVFAYHFRVLSVFVQINSEIKIGKLLPIILIMIATKTIYENKEKYNWSILYYRITCFTCARLRYRILYMITWYRQTYLPTFSWYIMYSRSTASRNLVWSSRVLFLRV